MEDLTGNLIIDPGLIVAFSYKGQTKKGNPNKLNVLEGNLCQKKIFLIQKGLFIDKKKILFTGSKFMLVVGHSWLKRGNINSC